MPIARWTQIDDYSMCRGHSSTGRAFADRSGRCRVNTCCLHSPDWVKLPTRRGRWDRAVRRWLEITRLARPISQLSVVVVQLKLARREITLARFRRRLLPFTQNIFHDDARYAQPSRKANRPPIQFCHGLFSPQLPRPYQRSRRSSQIARAGGGVNQVEFHQQANKIETPCSTKPPKAIQTAI